MAMRDACLEVSPPIAADAALAAGAALRSQLGPALPVALYAAPLTGEAVVAGAYQRTQDALSAHALSSGSALRRATGGVTVRAGDGIGYLALALEDASTLMRCPPRAILNRNVRGVLQGLRAAGAETNYFGRDYLAFGVLPGVYVAWARDEQGRMLLEFFIGIERDFRVDDADCAYPEPPEPPFRGRTPTCLTAVHGRSFAFEEVVAAIADTHAQQFGLRFGEPTSPSAPDDEALRGRKLRIREDELSWSSPQPEAIGFVSAGVAVDDAGAIADARLAGDFMLSEATEQTLAERARGLPADDAPLVGLVNGLYTNDAHFIEGVKDTGSILRVLRDALAAAR